MIFDTAATRHSPLAAWHAARASAWRMRAGMALPAAYRDAVDEHAPVILQDLSWRARCGCKGPRAEQWLRRRGIAVPQSFNSWLLGDGIFTARLAASEFLIESWSDDEGAHSGKDEVVQALAIDLATTSSLASGLQEGVQESEQEGLQKGMQAGWPQAPLESSRAALPGSGLYPVIRQDLAIGLRGPRANDLLLETCSVDFRELVARSEMSEAAGRSDAAHGRVHTDTTAGTTDSDRHERTEAGILVMTSMVGVGVTVSARRVAATVEYTIWSDPSFGPYLWTTLVEVAKSLHGGVRPSV